MNATIDIFLPKVLISSLDTVESMKQKIANTVANMDIGTIDLFDLNFSKKHMNHYGFITILLSNTDAARRFVRDIEDRGFAKLTDKDHYWRVCRYIALEKRRALDTAFIQEDCECEEEEEEEEEAPYWEEPNIDAPYEYGFTHSVANALDASANAFDASANALDASANALDASANALDASANALESSTFDTSTFDSQILDLLSDDEEINSVFELANTFEPSLDVSSPLDVPNCDYTIYTNWKHTNTLLNPIMASRIFPNITLLDVVDDRVPMPIPNLLIGVNSMYEISPSQKWMDWL